MCEGGNQEHERESLPAYLQGEGIVGVSRLRIAPAFIGPTICTLVYSAEMVRIDVVDARGFGSATFRGSITRPLRALRRFGPLASWERLRVAAFAAPSCCTPTFDGVGYRHTVLDWQGGIEVSWSNPSWSAHRQQCELAQAYQSLIKSSGILLEQGSRIRIRTGLMAGFIGRVERLERYEGRLRVVAELGGKGVSLDLAVSDIEFAPVATAEQSAAADRPRE
jgi:hypothetical protein